ncbi:hypothetical protein ACFWAY_49250 [Rhodococcus sp. NPDC059968]|uniref:hypothetical protein n=1 Tax=Rhodococcus sp. NPDC059968 TaxID=3347017 RepID=UPI0036700FDD
MMPTVDRLGFQPPVTPDVLEAVVAALLDWSVERSAVQLGLTDEPVAAPVPCDELLQARDHITSGSRRPPSRR